MQETTRESPDNQTAPPQQPQVSITLPAAQPLVTYALSSILVVVFVIQLGLAQTYYPDDPVLNWGVLDFYSVLHGDYYRLFTALFLHAGVVHIGFNAYALYVFGRTIERFFGHTRFALLYFLGGLCASLTSFIFSRGASLGASGAIMAIFGAEMVFLYQNRQLFGQERANRQLRALGLNALLIFGLGVYSNLAPGGVGGLRIDNWGHLGGFAAGLALSWFIAPRFEVRPVPASGIEPSAYQLADTNPLIKNWVIPAGFAVGLVVVFVVALKALSVYG